MTRPELFGNGVAIDEDAVAAAAGVVQAEQELQTGHVFTGAHVGVRGQRNRGEGVLSASGRLWTSQISPKLELRRQPMRCGISGTKSGSEGRCSTMLSPSTWIAVSQAPRGGLVVGEDPAPVAMSGHDFAGHFRLCDTCLGFASGDASANC